jgi:hypothetical protein
MLCLEMDSNVMLRFMVQALQDPLLCSSTDLWLVEAGNEHVFQMNTGCDLYMGTSKKT